MIGQTLGGYRIIEQIGMGGMATVYKAFQPSMERHVALKILPQRYSQEPEFIERFIREARMIAGLEHQSILPVYDFGEENGVTYLAMRYVDGGTLKDIGSAAKLELNDIARLMEQVGSALDYAHRKGIVHRDIKPANIMIDEEGSAYLMDFGIAKVLEGVPGLTQTGVAIGTPSYMAPEQSLGQPVDGRTDIYALGIILYELLVGKSPYEADTPMAVALAHIHTPLPIPSAVNPNISEAVENVIIKALAKAPEDRYQTAKEMADALSSAVADTPTVYSSEGATLQMLVHQAQTIRSQMSPDAETIPAEYHMPSEPAPTPAPQVDKPRKALPLPLIIGGVVIATAVIVIASLAALGVFSKEPVETAEDETQEVSDNDGDTADQAEDPDDGGEDTTAPTEEAVEEEEEVEEVVPTSDNPYCQPNQPYTIGDEPTAPDGSELFRLRANTGEVPANTPLYIDVGGWAAISPECLAANLEVLTFTYSINGEEIPLMESKYHPCPEAGEGYYCATWYLYTAGLSEGTYTGHRVYTTHAPFSDGIDHDGDGEVDVMDAGVYENEYEFTASSGG